MRTADKLWLTWFLISFLAFLIPEILALTTGHPENTLSASIWRLEAYTPHGWGWNAFRFLFFGAFTWFCIWLILHFSFHKLT